jgi:biotin transporter BioY
MGFIASLIAGFASGETVAALRRARGAAIAYALAGLAALCGVGFLVGAGYIWVAVRYGFLEAALGFGIGFLVLSGLILLIFRVSAESRVVRRARRRNADMTALGVTAALAALPVLLRSKGGLGAILGPAAALVAYAIYRENVKPGDGDDADKGGN